MTNPSKEEALQQHHLERCQKFKKEKVKEQAILFMGDSIVEFFSLKTYLGYDLPLVNHGIAGITAHWLEAATLDVLAQQRPDQVILLVGTNDIGQGYELEDIVFSIERIIQTLKDKLPQVRISLLSVLPVNEGPVYQNKVKRRRNHLVRELNRALAQLAGVDFINGYDCLLDQTGQLEPAYTSDGLHLTKAGYQALSGAIKPYLPLADK